MTERTWTQKSYPSTLRKGNSQVSIETMISNDGCAVVRTYNEIGAAIFQHSMFDSVALADAYVEGLKDGLLAVGKWHAQ